jgi:hypothetical protein
MKRFVAVVIAAVALALVPAALATGMLPGAYKTKITRDPALGGCNSTSITGLTHNETDHPLTLVLARHGFTNTWCTRPNPDVPAHFPSNRWKAGDDLFQTEIAVAYSFGHGIEVQFFARTGPAEGGCGFLTPAPVPYGCDAKLTVSARRHPVFVFTVFPKRQNKNGVNAQGQTGNH